MDGEKDKPGAPLPDPLETADKAQELERGFAQVRDEADADRVLDEAVTAPATRLEQVAAEAVATPEPTSQASLDRAITSVGQGPGTELTPQAQHGRDLLRKALLKRLRPFEAVDTALFLQVNQLPHPRQVDRAMYRFSYAMTGGWAWLLVPVIAGLLGNRRHAWRTAIAIAPALWVATSLVEYPIKHYFRRKRPFTDILRAVVVGRRAASFSFPSGHSAAAFAGAVLLQRYYPGQSPAFYALATAVAFSRVYLGAHYPGDVATGGLLGAFFARVVHGFWRRVGQRFIPALRGD